MRNARPTRRQLEAAADDLDFDALAIDPAEVAEAEAVAPADELAGVTDLLAEFDYTTYELAEFDFAPHELAEFEPVALAPVVPLDGLADRTAAELGEVA